VGHALSLDRCRLLLYGSRLSVHRVGRVDWNRLVESLGVIVVWLASITFFDPGLAGRRRAITLWHLDGAVTVLVGVGSLMAAQHLLAWGRSSSFRGTIGSAADVGGRNLAATSSPPFFRKSDEDTAFYALLQANTNLSRDPSYCVPE